MGDGTHIPVLGYGTSRIKLDGKVIRLANSLHVPTLHCDLFSATRHGQLGQGNSFMLADGKMHLSFPSFVCTRSIPSDNDMTISVERLTPEDWDLSPNVCDGGSIDSNSLDTNFGEAYDTLTIFSVLPILVEL